MKIAFLSFYSGQVERGVEIWTEELTKKLDKYHEVTIYQAGSKLGSSLYKRVDMPLDWSHQDMSNTISRKLYLDYWSKKILEFTRLSLKKIALDDPDIIIPTNGGWETILCKIFCLKKKKKMLIVGHAGIGRDDYVNLWVRPDAFIALNREQKQWALKNSFRTRVEQISDGVDTEKFTPYGDKIRLDLPKPIILIVSALSPWKRVDLTIKAVAQLKQGSLVVLGKGDKKQTADIYNLGKTKLGSRFLLTNVFYKDIPRWYRACDLLTLASWDREAFGMVLIEAMACNKPVVVTDDPIRREIVGEAGLYCNPENIGQYAKVLSKAFKTNFGDKPRKQAERFSWENIVVQYEGLIKSL